MIKGFENETTPLNDYEKNVILPVLAKALSRCIGKHRAVKNNYICNRMNAMGYDVSEVRVRKLINHIRVNGIVVRLMASSNGYYVSNDIKELGDYIESLKGREKAIKEVREAMEKQQYLQQQLF